MEFPLNALTKNTDPLAWRTSFAQHRDYFASAAPGANYFRPLIAALAPHDAAIVEIGAGSNPLFATNQYPNYHNIDYYSDNEIIEHFRDDYKDDVSQMNFAKVDFVCRDGRYSEVITSRNSYDLVCSSHNVEHQHCLIRFFRECEAMIKPQGLVVLLVPHKQYTFDALRNPSMTIDAIEAYHEGGHGARPRNLYEALSRSIIQNPSRLIRQTDPVVLDTPLRTAYAEYVKAREGKRAFQDFHNWVFTQDTLRLMLLELHHLQLTNLLPFYLSETIGNEFVCLLCRPEALDEGEVSDIPAQLLALYKSIHLPV
jgi:SAM-dependent methyltransferase